MMFVQQISTFFLVFIPLATPLQTKRAPALPQPRTRKSAHSDILTNPGNENLVLAASKLVIQQIPKNSVEANCDCDPNQKIGLLQGVKLCEQLEDQTVACDEVHIKKIASDSEYNSDTLSGSEKSVNQNNLNTPESDKSSTSDSQNFQFTEQISFTDCGNNNKLNEQNENHKKSSEKQSLIQNDSNLLDQHYEYTRQLQSKEEIQKNLSEPLTPRSSVKQRNQQDPEPIQNTYQKPAGFQKLPTEYTSFSKGDRVWYWARGCGTVTSVGCFGRVFVTWDNKQEDNSCCFSRCFSSSRYWLKGNFEAARKLQLYKPVLNVVCDLDGTLISLDMPTIYKIDAGKDHPLLWLRPGAIDALAAWHLAGISISVWTAAVGIRAYHILLEKIEFFVQERENCDQFRFQHVWFRNYEIDSTKKHFSHSQWNWGWDARSRDIWKTEVGKEDRIFRYWKRLKNLTPYHDINEENTIVIEDQARVCQFNPFNFISIKEWDNPAISAQKEEQEGKTGLKPGEKFRLVCRRYLSNPVEEGEPMAKMKDIVLNLMQIKRERGCGVKPIMHLLQHHGEVQHPCKLVIENKDNFECDAWSHEDLGKIKHTSEMLIRFSEKYDKDFVKAYQIIQKHDKEIDEVSSYSSSDSTTDEETREQLEKAMMRYRTRRGSQGGVRSGGGNNVGREIMTPTEDNPQPHLAKSNNNFPQQENKPEKKVVQKFIPTADNPQPHLGTSGGYQYDGHLMHQGRLKDKEICPHLENHPAKNSCATDFATDFSDIHSYADRQKSYADHEHTQSSFEKVKSLMNSFIRRKKNDSDEERDNPLEQHDRKAKQIHPLDVEYGRLLRWLASPDSLALAGIFQWRGYSYRVTEEKVEGLLLYIEAHTALLHSGSNTLGGFPDIRVKLEALVEDAKSVMMLALEALRPRRFLFARHGLALRTFVIRKIHLCEKFCQEGVLSVEVKKALVEEQLLPLLWHIRRHWAPPTFDSSRKKSNCVRNLMKRRRVSHGNALSPSVGYARNSPIGSRLNSPALSANRSKSPKQVPKSFQLDSSSPKTARNVRPMPQFGDVWTESDEDYDRSPLRDDVV